MFRRSCESTFQRARHSPFFVKQRTSTRNLLASIGSGLLLELVGWEAINIIALPLAAIAILTLAWGEHRKRNNRAVA